MKNRLAQIFTALIIRLLQRALGSVWGTGFVDAGVPIRK